MCSPLIIVVQKKGLLCIGVARHIKSDGHLSCLATVSPASKWDKLPLYMFLIRRVLAKLNSKVPDERQEQCDPHYREADMKSDSWSHEQFSPPMSLLTEASPQTSCSSEWTHLLLPCKPSSFEELWSTGGFQGGSCSPASAEESCGRRLLHSITFSVKNKINLSEHPQYTIWEKNEALKLGKGLPISPQHFKTTAHHFCKRQCPAPAQDRGSQWSVTLWEGPSAHLCAGWCITLDIHTK